MDKINNYITGEDDNSAIGLLICKDKDNVVAECSLEEVSQPIGIAEYELSMLPVKNLNEVFLQ